MMVLVPQIILNAIVEVIIFPFEEKKHFHKTVDFQQFEVIITLDKKKVDAGLQSMRQEWER